MNFLMTVACEPPAGGGGFDIASIFTGDRKGFAYNVNVGRTWQDSAMTTLCTASGDPVGAHEDLSGLGNHATQTTSGNKGVYYNEGGFKYLRLSQISGTPRALEIPMDTGSNLFSLWTQFLVFRFTAAGSNRYYVSHLGQNSTDLRTVGGASGLYAYSGNAFEYLSPALATDTVGSVMRVDDSATGGLVYAKNGVDFDSMTLTTIAQTAAADFSAIREWGGYTFNSFADTYCECILNVGVNDHLDAEELANVKQWIADTIGGWS